MYIINFNKNFKFNLLKILIVFVFLFNLSIFAGALVEVDGVLMYKNANDVIAKNKWVWIDTNNDGMAECYRFDKNGHLAINYKDKYGRETNSDGQLIENGVVIKKLLSSGEILKNKQTTSNGIINFFDNIINAKKTDTNKKIKNELKQFETNGINEPINNQIIENKYNKDVDILNGDSADSGIIYSNDKKNNEEDSFKNHNKNTVEIVFGKDFRKFISAKNKCIEKVEEVEIFGGEKWKDVLVLDGNKAAVKFLVLENNYIRFEIAHEKHFIATKDSNMSIEMYADGKLIDIYDEFVDNKPQVVEEYMDDVKVLELKLSITKGALDRKIYLRNGKFRKIKN